MPAHLLEALQIIMSALQRALYFCRLTL